MQRQNRQDSSTPVAAIVGYTNAGKSTLLNRLTDAGVLSEDKLFATLDPTTRALTLPNKEKVLMTDTVGFIRKLPHNLIEAFKSTLEEAKYADMIIHVVDCSNDDYERHMATVYETLKQLDVGDKPIITLFNKCDKYGELTHVWQPVYTVTPGITSKTIQKAVRGAEEAIDRLEDYLHDNVLDEYHIMGIQKAIHSIHFPQDEQKLKGAVKRMAFDEFYSFISNLHRIKDDNVYAENTCIINCDEEVRTFIENLRFRLTGAQMKAVRDMLDDMRSEHVMNRLGQGDVGSGNTIVAAAGLYAVAASGYQGVIMAPTEVLAVQHYKELSSLFEPYGISV